jgi:hypothetical protein
MKMPTHQYASAARITTSHAIGRHGHAVTPWLEPTAKPARPGVYERQVRLAPFSYWNGSRWGMSSQTPANAWRNRAAESLRQDARWRGLAEEPKP